MPIIHCVNCNFSMKLLHSVTAIKYYVIKLNCHQTLTLLCSKGTIVYSTHVVTIFASYILSTWVTQLSYRYWSDPWHHAIKLVTTPFSSMAGRMKLIMLITNSISTIMGRDSVVCIATRYGLGSPGIESLWGRDFLHLSRPALWSTQPPVHLAPGLFPGGKAARAWHWPPTPMQLRG